MQKYNIFLIYANIFQKKVKKCAFYIYFIRYMFTFVLFYLQKWYFFCNFVLRYFATAKCRNCS